MCAHVRAYVHAREHMRTQICGLVRRARAYVDHVSSSGLPAQKEHAPMTRRMLNTAEPTIVPKPTSLFATCACVRACVCACMRACVRVRVRVQTRP